MAKLRLNVEMLGRSRFEKIRLALPADATVRELLRQVNEKAKRQKEPSQSCFCLISGARRARGLQQDPPSGH